MTKLMFLHVNVSKFICILFILFQTTECLTITKTVILDPHNITNNGATITELNVVVDQDPLEWELRAIGADTWQGFHLQLTLNSSWGFHPTFPTVLTIEVDADTNTTATSNNHNLLVAFQQTNSTKYFATLICMDGKLDHEMLPAFTTTQPYSSYLSGNIKSIVDANPYNFRSFAAGQEDWGQTYTPFISVGSRNIQSPLKFILQNYPSQYLLYTYVNPNTIERTCGFNSPFKPDTGMNIYFAADAYGLEDNVDMMSIKVTLEYDIPTTFPTVNPTIVPTVIPTNIPTAQPSSDSSTINPTKFPTINPSILPAHDSTDQPYASLFPSIIPTIIPTKNPSETLIVTATISHSDEEQDVNIYVGKHPFFNPFNTDLQLIMTFTVILLCCCLTCLCMCFCCSSNKSNKKHQGKLHISKISIASLSPSVGMSKISRNELTVPSKSKMRTTSVLINEYLKSQPVESRSDGNVLDNILTSGDINEDTGPDTGDTITDDDITPIGTDDDEKKQTPRVTPYMGPQQSRDAFGGYLDDFKVASVDSMVIHLWLKSNVELPEYFENFVKNGYETLDMIKDIAAESELAEIGILCKKHCVTIMKEIHELKVNEMEEMEMKYQHVHNDPHFMPLNPHHRRIFSEGPKDHGKKHEIKMFDDKNDIMQIRYKKSSTLGCDEDLERINDDEFVIQGNDELYD